MYLRKSLFYSEDYSFSGVPVVEREGAHELEPSNMTVAVSRMMLELSAGWVCSVLQWFQGVSLTIGQLHSVASSVYAACSTRTSLDNTYIGIIWWWRQPPLASLWATYNSAPLFIQYHITTILTVLVMSWQTLSLPTGVSYLLCHWKVRREDEVLFIAERFLGCCAVLKGIDTALIIHSLFYQWNESVLRVRSAARMKRFFTHCMCNMYVRTIL